MPLIKRPISRKNRKKIYIIGTIVLIILFDLSPFGGTIKYYATWASCGSQPVATAGSGYLNGSASSYYTPPKFNPFPGTQDYFCTAFDAEKHGYAASENYYDFPVLKAQNALCQKPTDPKSETAARFQPCEK